MSGIVGILNFDNAKVEENLLLKLTKKLTYRGINSQNIWLNNNIGFGHTLLKTTFESEYEIQPFTLDNQVYISADARIDDRENLMVKLGININNSENLVKLTDVELILRSYLKWDQDCLNYLIGDFAFAIWDNRKKTLFCARDHFGIKPFFYTKIGNTFLFASDIQTLQEYPSVSCQLSEMAIADYLIFGSYQEENTTAYKNIYRLPAAHKIIIQEEKIIIQRYWTLQSPPFEGELGAIASSPLSQGGLGGIKTPFEGELGAIASSPLSQGGLGGIKTPFEGGLGGIKNSLDYIEHYQELLTIAVKDRLRFNKVNALMSGGIDSSAIAAIASKYTEVKAFTEMVKNLFPDEEPYYADIVAKHLGIDIEYFAHDDYQMYERWQELLPNFIEPCNSPFMAGGHDFTQLCLSHSPIFLSGLGGDEVLYAHRLYYVELLKKGQIREFCHKTWQHWQRYGTLQGLAIRSGIKQMLGLNMDLKPSYPSWIKPEFTKRLNLQERFEYYTQTKPYLHKTHPEAYQGLTSPLWSFALESNTYPFGLEIRYPFFDLRLVNYILAIPPIPWCFNKHIHRASIKNMLPSIIVNRPKTALSGDRLWYRMNQFNDLDSLDLNLNLVSQLYIDKNKYIDSLNEYKKQEYAHNYFSTSPVSLEYWLKVHDFKST